MSHKYFSAKLVKFLVVAVACFLLIFFNPQGVFNPVRKVFFGFAYPFQKVFYLAGRNISETFFFFSAIGEMRKENEKLIRENYALSFQIASLQEIQKENETLRAQLDLLPRNKFETESAFVIGQDPQGLGGWIVIGKGESDGIFPGMPVIVSEGILLGKVEEVNWSSSRVKLLSDAGSIVNAIDIETGAKGLIKGEYGLGLKMDMVAQSDILNEGDTIITSGLGRELPRGLLIGKIQEIRVSPDKLFQQAIVMPKVSHQKIDIVFVIKN